MPLIVLSGLPGSGKTTFATQLGQERAILHLESDALRRSMYAEPTYTREEHAAVFEELERRVDEGLAEGKLVVVDATNLKETFRRRHAELAARHNEPLVCVHLTAPLAVLRERVSGPREGHSQAGVTVLEAMVLEVERFREPAIVVDTRYDLGPSVRSVVRLAGSGA